MGKARYTRGYMVHMVHACKATGYIRGDTHNIHTPGYSLTFSRTQENGRKRLPLGVELSTRVEEKLVLMKSLNTLNF